LAAEVLVAGPVELALAEVLLAGAEEVLVESVL
jgi:hypothetical protein